MNRMFKNDAVDNLTGFMHSLQMHGFTINLLGWGRIVGPVLKSCRIGELLALAASGLDIAAASRPACFRRRPGSSTRRRCGILF